MSQGVHARPNPRGGGLTALLAVLIGGAGLAYALSPGGVRSVRLGVLGLAALMVVQLLAVSAQQRTVTRTLARTQERLRVLELRTRAESEELHQRVLDGIKREGLLLDAVTGLSDEIARLRLLLESAALAALPAVPALPAMAVAEQAPEQAAEVPQVEPLAPAPLAAEPEPVQRPYVPTVPVTTWVVREIVVEGEPAAVSMRILDLTDSGTETASEAERAEAAEAERAEWPTPAAAWGQYARPA